MEHFIEGVLELVFGFVKDSPEKMPEIAYKDKFVIKNNPKKITMRIVVSLIFAIVFCVGCFLLDSDTRSLFLLFIILDVFILFLSIETLSFKCIVTEDMLYETSLFTCKKNICWKDIICVRICETTDEKSVIIALYNDEKKCVLDVSTTMENAWLLVKMAQHKNIEIREDKDLTIKQMKKL